MDNVTISVVIGGQTIASQPLDSFGKDSVSFGRALENDITIDSRYISRHHGWFQRQNGHWYVYDGGSRNGILISGRKALSGALLANGQELWLCDPGAAGSESVCFRIRVTAVSEAPVGAGAPQRGTGASNGKEQLMLHVFDGERPVRSIPISDLTGPLSFGRAEDNNIVLQSELVSSHHGSIRMTPNGCMVTDLGSRNGLLLGRTRVNALQARDGTVVRIDDPNNPMRQGVSLLFTAVYNAAWRSLPLEGLNEVIIGRDPNCTLCLDQVSVSRRHARLFRQGNDWYIEDLGSTNGVSVNGRTVDKRTRLQERDLILITSTKLVFLGQNLSYLIPGRGIGLEAIDIVRTVKSGGKSKNITDHISLSIEPGEFVAIIGGSGAGKSTFMNCISGYVKADSGLVLVNGEDLYRNYQVMKADIGYVPQQDIVYDDLKLQDMLMYAARLRMPSDTGKEEMSARVAEVIRTVELTGHEETFIRQLSGGQKKRASIAVELLSDPRLFFLDEPTSGLDPGTERNLMHTLREMSAGGKTVILVTHNTLNLHLCDKIIFLGRGGRLCFCGSPDDALRFFGTESLVDVYSLLEADSAGWNKRFLGSSYYKPPKTDKSMGRHSEGHKKTQPFFRQLGILCARYIKLLTNDRQRMLLLLAQAVLLAVLIAIVSDGDQFEKYSITKAVVFALACSAFWVGVLNAIQEICKERVILKREYANSLSLGAYVLSKFFVLGLFCLIQTLLLSGTFALLVGMPEEGVIGSAFWEFVLTTYLCMLSAMGMGLLVSAMFTNPDRAMTVAPILLMPQILFSGLAFKLSGAVEKLSAVVTCRWAMEAYGTITNLNVLKIDYGLPEGFPEPEREIEAFYEFTKAHLLTAWGILAATVVIFALICLLLTRWSMKKN